MREKLPQQPTWDERFIGWSTKFIAKNIWRCDPIHEFKDHMQDAYLTFRYILASYPKISDPKHIMALYQVAMINDYNDRAVYRKRKVAVEVSVETTIGEDLKILDTLGEYNNEGHLNVLLSQLPPKIKTIIEALKKGSTNGSERRKREYTLGELNGIIDLPKGTDLVGMVYSALIGEEVNMSEHVQTVEQELINVTKFVPEKKYGKNQRQAYLTALMRAVDGLADTDFVSLSEPAAEWADRAVIAFKSGQDLPDFDLTPTNGKTHSEQDGSEPHEVIHEGHWGAMEQEPPPSPKKEGRAARRAKAKAPESNGESTESVSNVGPTSLNRWGVAVGTKAAAVCELIARPEGATMKEIAEYTGHTQYNVVNRLQRKGHRVVKEGTLIRLLS